MALDEPLPDNRRTVSGAVGRYPCGRQGARAGRHPACVLGDVNHGLVGYFQIPEEQQYEDALTVAYNGRPLTVKYRPYRFGAKDDIAILEPRKPMSPSALLYVAAVLNARRWRYSYGRKCFKRKLESVGIEMPEDISCVDRLLAHVPLDKRPCIAPQAPHPVRVSKWVERRLDGLFDLTHGDFHSLKNLASGPFVTVSRTEADNGVVGYFEQPDGSTLHPPGLITVSTVSGDAFVQMEQFQATDNVVVCVPRQPMRRTSSYFVAAMINSQKWRYSYGRQPYIGKLSALTIRLPWRGGAFDEATIERMVESQPYWQFVETNLGTVDTTGTIIA